LQAFVSTECRAINYQRVRLDFPLKKRLGALCAIFSAALGAKMRGKALILRRLIGSLTRGTDRSLSSNIWPEYG